VEVSSGKDQAPKTNTLTGKQKEPIGDDTEGEAVSSVKPIAPGLISSNVLEQAVHSIADQFIIVDPSVGWLK
jgi:hypothetical protein